MKVYTVLHTQIEAEDFQNPFIETKVFDDEKKAEKYLAKDYEEVLDGLKHGNTVHDIICADNYGNNAEILLGEGDTELVYVNHTWRVYTDTVNYEGREEL